MYTMLVTIVVFDTVIMIYAFHGTGRSMQYTIKSWYSLADPCSTIKAEYYSITGPMQCTVKLKKTKIGSCAAR